MPVYHYGQHSIMYRVERSGGRRGLTLLVDPREGVIARAPLRMEDEAIAAFVRRKADWLVRHLLRFEARARDGGILAPGMAWLGGEQVRLSIIAAPNGSQGDVGLWLDGIYITLPVTDGLDEQQRDAAALELLERWYLRRAARELRPLVARYCAMLGLPTALTHIRRQSARWGSCSSDRSIRLNWRLVMTPPALMDYVCAHECCHLIEMNHGPRFWALMARVMPDYAQRRAALRDTGGRYL
jgi:predicted metal-dependent hydrolase